MQVPTLSQYAEEGGEVGVGSSIRLYTLQSWPGIMRVSVSLCEHCG